MIGYVAAGVGGFVVGVLVGVLLRDAFVIATTGKGYLVDTSRDLLHRASVSRRFGVVLIVAALAANAVVGLLLIGTRIAVDDQNRRLEALATCQERYNRVKGEALSSRDRAIREGVDVEIQTWRELRDTIAIPTSPREDLVATIDDHIRELEAIQRTRVGNPYPDPDLCRRLVP